MWDVGDRGGGKVRLVGRVRWRGLQSGVQRLLPGTVQDVLRRELGHVGVPQAAKGAVILSDPPVNEWRPNQETWLPM